MKSILQQHWADLPVWGWGLFALTVSAIVFGFTSFAVGCAIGSKITVLLGVGGIMGSCFLLATFEAVAHD